MTNLDSILKSRDITLLVKVHLVKAMVFPVVIYGCESWTIKKAEHRRIDAFELWCWRRLLRVPWPRVCLICEPEIPVAPGEKHQVLDTSLDEVSFFPAVTREQSPTLTLFLLQMGRREDLWSKSTFYQEEGSLLVPGGTWPWSLFYTLTHWPSGPGQHKICDAERIYSCLDIWGIWLLSGIATKSSDFNLPSKDKKWFQEKPR